MMKCLASLMSAPMMLVASAIAPHAEQCPVFTGPENYTCDSRIGPSRPKFPLAVKQGSVDGAPAYQITSSGGSSTLTIGKTTETSINGKVIVSTAKCGVFIGQKDPTPYPSVVMTEQEKGKTETSTTYFYPAKKGVVRISFGANGTNGAATSYNVCQPVTTGKAAPKSTPSQPPAPKPAGTP